MQIAVPKLVVLVVDVACVAHKLHAVPRGYPTWTSVERLPMGRLVETVSPVFDDLNL